MRKRRIAINKLPEFERVTIRFPKSLLAELRRMVPFRDRSRLILEATDKRLAEIKLQRALEIGAGAWSDENHPDLNTREDMRRYLRELRESFDRRLQP